jgi:hypothetical protein
VPCVVHDAFEARRPRLAHALAVLRATRPPARRRVSPLRLHTFQGYFRQQVRQQLLRWFVLRTVHSRLRQAHTSQHGLLRRYASMRGQQRQVKLHGRAAGDFRHDLKIARFHPSCSEQRSEARTGCQSWSSGARLCYSTKARREPVRGRAQRMSLVIFASCRMAPPGTFELARSELGVSAGGSERGVNRGLKERSVRRRRVATRRCSPWRSRRRRRE